MGRLPTAKESHMNKNVRVTLRVTVIKEYTETITVPMSATQKDLQAFARTRMGQVPSSEFRDSTEAWRPEGARVEVLNEPVGRMALRAALDELGKLCAYAVSTKREINPPKDWPLGVTHMHWVTPLEGTPDQPAEDAWLFEVRDHNGNLMADRLIRGRLGLNQFYEDMVGYQPDSDEYRHDLNQLRDEVLEMFYRHTTNDPN